MKDGRYDAQGKELESEFNPAAKPRVEIDIDKYQSYLDGSGLTPEQKDDFLRALWTIMVTFVDLGFGVHPVQQACGQVEKSLDLPAQADSDRVSLGKAQLSKHFNDAPDGG